MKLTASTLIKLLQTLGALCADYKTNLKGKIAPELAALLTNWDTLDSLANAIKSAKSGRGKVEALYNVGVELKQKMAHFKEIREYTTPELNMLGNIRGYLMTDNEAKFAYICKNASIFHSPLLSTYLAPPEAEESDVEALISLVHGLNGNTTRDTGLSIDECKKLKQDDPDGYDRYLELHRAFIAEGNSKMVHFIRESGSAKVKYQDVYTYLTGLGFPVIRGFKGLIDDQGKWYTKDGKLISGKPTLSFFSKVEMNPDPSGEWVCKAVGETTQYYYTEETKKRNDDAKFERVRSLNSKMPGIIKKWRVKVKNFDNSSKECVCAVILEILYTYAARIGTEQGRGAGYLQVKHASVVQNGINLAYLGKDSIPTKHKLRETDPVQRQLIADLTIMMEGKKPSDNLFTYEKNGVPRRVTREDVNDAFHAFGAPEGLTVHKLRTYRGTKLFIDLSELDAQKKPPRDAKEAMARYTKMAEEVGTLLNHQRGVGTDKQKVTGVTALTSYIDNDVQLALWNRWGFRPPKHLEKYFAQEACETLSNQQTYCPVVCF